MNKTPYTYGLLLPTISPALHIAIYEETRAGISEIYAGKAIKSRDIEGITEREVQHIGINEIDPPPFSTDTPTLEIFLY